MVVSDASYYIPNERKRIKVAKWGTPKKKLKKKKLTCHLKLKNLAFSVFYGIKISFNIFVNPIL
jgi:hypothetical protein